MTDTGIYTIYMPNSTQLRLFSEWLWSTDLLNNLFTDPLSTIVGLYMCPILPDNVVNSDIKIAGKDTGVNAAKVLNQYQYVSFGSINIKNFYGNFLDYSIKATIYLPYVGYRELNIDEFTGGVIYLDYLIDFATGTCVAFLRSENGNLKSVVEQFTGSIYSEISLTAQDARGLQSALINSAISLSSGIISHNPAVSVAGLSSSVLNAVSTNKSISHSGSLTINSGYLSVQKPYITFFRPTPSLSQGMKKDIGYMSNIYSKLGDLKGFTKVLYIDLSGITCTDEERERLLEMLRDGVYL